MKERVIQTTEEFLSSLPPDRHATVSTVRQLILDNLPDGYRECVSYGMLTYIVPLERYPTTHNKQPLMMAALASQKSYMSLHLVCVYGWQELNDWFVAEWKKSGKKLDMGKACVRFKKLDDLPLELIAKTIARVSVEQYIAFYEKIRNRIYFNRM